MDCESTSLFVEVKKCEMVYLKVHFDIGCRIKLRKHVDIIFALLRVFCYPQS